MHNEEEREPEKGNTLQKEMSNTPKLVRVTQKKNSVRWGVIALVIFILMITVWVFATNKSKESYLLEEMKGEEVVTDRNFSVGW